MIWILVAVIVAALLAFWLQARHYRGKARIERVCLNVCAVEVEVLKFARTYGHYPTHQELLHISDVQRINPYIGRSESPYATSPSGYADRVPPGIIIYQVETRGDLSDARYVIKGYGAGHKKCASAYGEFVAVKTAVNAV